MALGKLHSWSYETRKGRVLGCVASGKRHHVNTKPVCAMGKSKKKAISKARKRWHALKRKR